MLPLFFASLGVVLKEQDGSSDYRRDCMIENWMEKKGSRKVEIPRSYRNSSSSSSDSSSKGGFSSSESEHSTPNKLRYSTSCYSIKKLRPIRTETVSRPQTIEKYRAENEAQANPSCYSKPQMKALKIYGSNRDSISPGAKLAGFLNSLFNNAKKTKGENFPKSGHSSTCSSASSFSRSCLSKKNSSNSKGKNKHGDTRSVRFCPNVSEVLVSGNKLDHVLKGHKQEPLSRRREEVENMVKNYQKKRSDINGEDEDDDDDGVSCASSDLFELDHLSGVGIGGDCRFDEELPLYETTNLNMKKTANSFRM